jgi:glycosyltransferase involved in cell wall biosynthesis
MNKYVLLSSVLPPFIFQQRIDAGEVINPSHQLYFSRWIQSLSKLTPVQIICLPPLRKANKHLWNKESIHRDNQQVYLQFGHPNHRYLKALWLSWSSHRYIQKLLHSKTDLIYLFIDGNSAIAGQIAKRYRRHPRIRTIGIFTDSPAQLTGISKSKAKQWVTLHQHHFAYIGITEPLLALFNPKQKPQLVIPGIVESAIGAKHHPRPYVFFSGALYSRYGIDSFINGFLQLNNQKLDLLVSGFGPEASMIEQLSQQHRHIKFLGLLSPTQVRKYQAGAYVNVNPRPLDKTLDAVAIPSKVLDYIASGAPTLTTRHPFFESHFDQTLQWIEDASEDGIRVSLQQFLNLDYSLVQAKAIKAKNIAIQEFGIETTGQRLWSWINSLK